MALGSRLQKSPYGIYYLRIQGSGLDRKWSLRTRDPNIATIAAHALSVKLLQMKINIDMSRPRLGWDIEEKDGQITKIKTEDNDADRQSALEIYKLNLAHKLALAELANLAKTSLPIQSIPVLHAPIPHVASNELSLNHEPAIKKTVTLEIAITEYEPVLIKRVENGDLAAKTMRQALSVLNGLKDLLGAKFNMYELTDEIVEDRWFTNRRLTVEHDTARRDLSHVRVFVEWSAYRTRKYAPANLTFAVKAMNGKHYDYLDAADLKLIFDNLPANAETAWQFWIVILGLYTGARISELGSLRVDSFAVKSGLNTMFLAGTKTDTSPRTLPIHADLLALGLLDYVEKRKKEHRIMLFDVLYSESNGWGDEPSGWFTEYKKIIGLTAEMKVFHSFRHTIVDHMTQRRVTNEKAASQYTGHSEGGGVRKKIYARRPVGLTVIQKDVVLKINWLKYCGWELDFFALKAKADAFL